MVDSVLEVQNIKTTGITPQKDIVTTDFGTGDVTVKGNVVVPDGGTIGSASDTDAITIDSSGNVGIGTTSPRKKLEIDGALLLSDGGYYNNEDVVFTFSTDDSYGGSAISRNAQKSPPYIGLLFAYEIGQNKSFLAFVHKKDDTTTAPQITPLASHGLSLGATNNSGTITVSGYTTAGNVRMKMMHIGYL